MDWNNYTSAEIRLEFTNFVVNHNHSKMVELLRKRNGRAKKTKNLKAELAELKVKNELENFCEEIK